MTTTQPHPGIHTLADLLNGLGGIPADRVLFIPAPGTATEQDVVDAHLRERRLCELVDGTLIEKAMGYRESILAAALISFLRAFVVPRNLGLVSGEAGMLRLLPGLIRIPDVAFISWDRLPGRRTPHDAVPNLAPDLAVEILSQSNTEAEMTRKRREYFSAGARLVWIVDPDARTISEHHSSGSTRRLSESDALDGADVLPGFAFPIRDLFAELDRVG